MIFKTGQPRTQLVLSCFGQSNIGSQVSAIGDLPSDYAGVQSMIEILDVGTVTDPITPRFVPVYPGVNTGLSEYTHVDSPYTPVGMWGQEQAFCHNYVAEYNKKISVVKGGYGGTFLSRWDRPSGDGWVEQSTKLLAAIAHFESINVTPRFISIWMQGENDASVSGQAATYDVRFMDYITDLWALHPSLNNTPVIAVKIPSTFIGSWEDYINDAFDYAVANGGGNIYALEVETYLSDYDGVHWESPNGIVQIGNQLYNLAKTNNLL